MSVDAFENREKILQHRAAILKLSFTIEWRPNLLVGRCSCHAEGEVYECLNIMCVFSHRMAGY